MINIEEVEHICELANIELNENEKEKITEELVDILEYVDKLNELDTKEVEPTAYPVSLKNVMREDGVKSSLSREEVLKNAPDNKKGQFRVPPIMKNDDE